MPLGFSLSCSFFPINVFFLIFFACCFVDASRNQKSNNLIASVRKKQISLIHRKGEKPELRRGKTGTENKKNESNSLKLLRCKSVKEELIRLITEALLEKDKQDLINQ